MRSAALEMSQYKSAHPMECSLLGKRNSLGCIHKITGGLSCWEVVSTKCAASITHIQMELSLRYIGVYKLISFGK